MNPSRTIVFYDGECALCHGFVLFLLNRDKKRDFYFSPLQGETIRKLLSADQRAVLPDSVVVRAFAGEIYIKSEAVDYVLRRLGVFWKLLAVVTSILPLFFRNFVYDQVARFRKKIFGTTKMTCPIVPHEFRERFLL